METLDGTATPRPRRSPLANGVRGSSAGGGDELFEEEEETDVLYPDQKVKLLAFQHLRKEPRFYLPLFLFQARLLVLEVETKTMVRGYRREHTRRGFRLG